MPEELQDGANAPVGLGEQDAKPGSVQNGILGIGLFHQAGQAAPLESHRPKFGHQINVFLGHHR
ncbi:hypothetical protein MOMUL_30890 [Moorella mulderi DSM 14980]|uniref:Uncharacterized protein n=1 Tax=Moorella mulderi DSM 14980 TaxID=1122241 RepID=A0A151AMQ9_9FIRM|nr:hypothetical protein MOMUL_30890 [Moorella mulderi DSM 14980]